MTHKIGNLSPAEIGAIKDFKENLHKALKDSPFRTVLFGSRARGEGNANSDIDILVLLKQEKHHLRKEIYDIASEILLEHDIDLSPFVISEERFEWLKNIERGIALDIEREGIDI